MMTREEVIRLAKEAGPEWWLDTRMLQRFAELVAAEYKQDALRYRTLKASSRFCVDEKCGGDWEPIYYDDLDHALDEEIGEGK